MNLFHKLCKELVACLQVHRVCHSLHIAGCLAVVRLACCKKFSLICYNFSIMRINMVIILNVIFMVRRGYEERVKINNLHSKALQIVELLSHAFQIPTVKFADGKIRRTGIPVFHPPARALDIIILLRQNIVRRISIVKTVHQNLVHHRALRPCRCPESRDNTEQIVFTLLPAHTIAVKKYMEQTGSHLKIIVEWFFPKLHFHFIIIKLPAAADLRHLKMFLSGTQPDDVHVVFPCPETDLYRLPHFRLHRIPVVCGTV